MCGVIGFVGEKIDVSFLFKGLKFLEYRGYDSSGIAVIDKGQKYLIKAKGKLDVLEPKLSLLPKHVSIGVGHTRWATHGEPSEENAHPHASENFVLVHNGIIENYLTLKQKLKDYTFHSETDTEVALHLLCYHYKKLTIKDPVERTQKAIELLISEISGTFGFVILNTDTPDTIYCAKQSSPLVLAHDARGSFVASGIAPLLEVSKNIFILDDGEIALLTKDDIKIFDFTGQEKAKETHLVEWSLDMVEKGTYAHYMHKEIFEHPLAIQKTFEKYTKNNETIELDLSNLNLDSIERITLIACGTSFFACSAIKHFIENWTLLPVDVDLASEARYRRSSQEKTLCIAVSQSGETIDTIKTVQFFKTLGAQILAVINAPGSSMSFISNASLLTQAGPEIGVASTKAFTAQLMALLLIGLKIALHRKKITPLEAQTILSDLADVPRFARIVLERQDHIRSIAKKYFLKNHVLYIGRGSQWAIALEGALKIKEISYIHAEGYSGGELKHGPIALIDGDMIVISLAPLDQNHEKTLSNIQEIKARHGKIITVGNEGDHDLQALSDDMIFLPKTHSPESGELIYPFLTSVAVHLFAYWCAVFRGTDIDQPKNLAKSVTVE